MFQRRIPARSQFQVRDANGDERTLYASTEIVISTYMDGKNSARGGPLEIRTAEGHRVNVLADGRFEAVDPDAV